MNTTESIQPAPPSHNRPIAIWLFACCVIVFGMVVLGGVTRLTGSGLSMVEWNPIFGIIPPLNQQEWLNVFELYKQSPEYLKINIGMDLSGFKQIYWFEFSHRLLGRSIGMVFLVPFLVFLARGWISRALTPKLIAMFILGGLQGLLGWYMVKSGLVNNPHVSQYRLTAHLGLAVIIYAYMLHVALGLWHTQRPTGTTPAWLHRWTHTIGILVFITLLSGGFVAGLKAGYAYNTFPLMNGRLVPEFMFIQEPLWRNFFENVATVQFDHRLLATLVFFNVLGLWLVALKQPLPQQVKNGIHLLLLAAIAQVSLGISTLLLHVPLPLAATHQGVALVLLTAAIYVTHRMACSR